MNKGVIYMLVAAFFSACAGGFAKVLSGYMEPLEVVFFRNIVGMLLILISLPNKPLQQTGGRPILLLFRGVIGSLAVMAWFYNVAHISLANAMTFSNTSPVFTAIFAWIFLKEKIGARGWIAIFIGFIGLIFIMKPDGLKLDTSDLLGIFSGVGAGLAYTSIRELRKYYDPRTIVLAFMTTGSVGSSILLFSPIQVNLPGFITAGFIIPQGIMWFYIAGLGIFSLLMQTLMTKAYALTKAGIVGAVSYTNILFSMMIGFMLGDSLPDIIGALGMLLIICSGILILNNK